MAPRPLEPFVWSTGGAFRSKPERRWLPIRSVEYFTAATPGFVWRASISPAPLVWIDACDRLHNRHGNMLVKLESLFAIADASGSEMDKARACAGLPRRSGSRTPSRAT